MTKGLFRLLPVLLLAGAAALTSCDNAQSPSDVSVAPAVSGMHAVVPAASVIGSDGHPYKLLNGPIHSNHNFVSKWLGPAGGTLSIAGRPNHGVSSAYTLTVPAGAVTQRTLFSIGMTPGTRVSIRLRARRQVLGVMTDVGQNGFLVPIGLSMSAAWATNLVDPTHLVILYDPENGTSLQPVTSVAVAGQLQVTAQLTHFSKYAAAEN